MTRVVPGCVPPGILRSTNPSTVVTFTVVPARHHVIIIIVVVVIIIIIIIIIIVVATTTAAAVAAAAADADVVVIIIIYYHGVLSLHLCCGCTKQHSVSTARTHAHTRTRAHTHDQDYSSAKQPALLTKYQSKAHKQNSQHWDVCNTALSCRCTCCSTADTSDAK